MRHLINSLNSFLLKAFSTEADATNNVRFSLNTFDLDHEEECIYFLSYKQNQHLLISLKYGDDSALALVADSLYTFFKNSNEELGLLEHEPRLIVPLPQSRLRVLKRGFNQSRRILETMLHHDKERYFRLETNNLIKIHETKKQAFLSRAERLVSQKGAYTVRNPERFRGKTVFLFDDVVTTGATLKEARKELLKAGAKRVVCVALAH